MTSPDESNVRDMLINPYYAITFADSVFNTKKQEVAKEDWVLTNAKLINENAENWLDQLLLSLSDKSDVIQVAPYKVVVISPNLAGSHEPIVTIGNWKTANLKLLKELGTEEWLWRLLGVLETGSPPQP